MAEMAQLDRLLIEKIGPMDDGCWFWQGAGSAKNEHGSLTRGGKRRIVHRYVYEQFVEPIPEGMVIHHICGERTCVNPDHLEPVTPTEHGLRHRYAATHCVNGHEWTEENTVWVRVCKTCQRQHLRESDCRNP